MDGIIAHSIINLDYLKYDENWMMATAFKVLEDKKVGLDFMDGVVNTDELAFCQRILNLYLLLFFLSYLALKYFRQE